MKVFISWSGDRSKAFASEFGPWLQDVLQNLHPFVSADDIDKGARWANAVNDELGQAGFGIVCLTSDTLRSPWINFEAGALSRRFADSGPDAPVATLLLDGDSAGAIPQPLAQFNGTVGTEKDIFKLVKSLNTAMGGEDGSGVAPERLKRAFDMNWTTLEEAIKRLRATSPPTESVAPDPIVELPAKVDEALSILREMNRSSGTTPRRAALPESARREFGSRIDEIFRRLMPGVEPIVVWDNPQDYAPTILSTKPAGEDVKEAVRSAGARNQIEPGFRTVNPGDSFIPAEGNAIFIGRGGALSSGFSGEGTLTVGAPVKAKLSTQEIAADVVGMMLLQAGLDLGAMKVVEADLGSIDIYVPHFIHNSVLQKVRDAVRTTTEVLDVQFFTRGEGQEMVTLDPDNPGEA